jgi:hypothetical protein
MCDDLEIGEERQAAPGLRVSRRSAVGTLGAFLVAAAQSTAMSARAQELIQPGLTFAEFLALANPLAKDLIRDTSRTGQDRYLLSLASLATRLMDVAVPELRDSGQGETAGSFIGANPGGEPFNVLHWKLDPGARVRPHAHTYGNVVTVGLQGLATVENFEVVGERRFEARAPVRIRRTRLQQLTPGGINLVSLERDYVHGIAAGREGARGLDITSRIKPREPTPYLIFAKGAATEAEFDASWSLDDPMRG